MVSGRCPPTPVGSQPPLPLVEEIVSSQGLGTGWPGAGEEGEGAAWHRKAAWVCVACVFQSLTFDTVAQSKKAQLIARKKDPGGEDACVSKELGGICKVGI